MAQKKAQRQVNVRFDRDLVEKVEAVSERLDLRVSDVVRRAVLVGLKAFDDARLPGSPTTDAEAQ